MMYLLVSPGNVNVGASVSPGVYVRLPSRKNVPMKISDALPSSRFSVPNWWRHQLGTENLELGKASEIFIGTFFRDGSLTYTPGLTDAPTFTFPGDTNRYIIAEDRNFRTTGAKIDYTARPP